MLGERLERTLLDVLELLLQAALYTRQATGSATGNLRLEVARHLWRLAHELQGISTRRYAHGAGLMDDVGRQIGAWLRNRRQREQTP
jgi:hypothetical protein